MNLHNELNELVRAEVNEAKDIDSIATEIAEMTDDNDHEGARLALAEYLKHKVFIKVYKAIIEIHDISGNYNFELLKFRDSVDKELFKFAKSKLCKDYDLIHNAF